MTDLPSLTVYTQRVNDSIDLGSRWDYLFRFKTENLFAENGREFDEYRCEERKRPIKNHRGVEHEIRAEHAVRWFKANEEEEHVCTIPQPCVGEKYD